MKITAQTYLDERLDLIPLRYYFRAHALGYLARVTLDASNDCMWIWSLFGPLIQLLDHNDLLPRLPALQDKCDLSVNSDVVSALSSCVTSIKQSLFQACKLRNRALEQGLIINGILDCAPLTILKDEDGRLDFQEFQRQRRKSTARHGVATGECRNLILLVHKQMRINPC